MNPTFSTHEKHNKINSVFAIRKCLKINFQISNYNCLFPELKKNNISSTTNPQMVIKPKQLKDTLS